MRVYPLSRLLQKLPGLSMCVNGWDFESVFKPNAFIVTETFMNPKKSPLTVNVASDR